MSDLPLDEASARLMRRRRAQQRIQRQLDEALAATFPASDPVSIVTSQEEEDWGAEPCGPAPTEP
ncbi:MAG TPA: hypothetical protein VEU54_12650 [Steroidobacteraceae bacterium]|jgi:hypothetical protein|nr:hypothetical protein [Steroidobacteraceae bacterium]